MEWREREREITHFGVWRERELETDGRRGSGGGVEGEGVEREREGEWTARWLRERERGRE